MNKNNRKIGVFLTLALLIVVILCPNPSFAQIERFKLSEGKAIEVWRITNDPTVRDWVNYHNTQCWSPDGRYICYTHYASDDKEFGTSTAAEIHIYDMYKDKDIKVDNGTNPRWANNNNWLFYTRFRPQDGPSHEKGTQVMWLDVDTQKLTRIAYGVRTLKETDYGDRWLYGIITLKGERSKGVRIPIKSDSRPEILPEKWGVGYNSLYVNPVHPMIVSRDHNYADHYYATEGTRDIPFVARHFFDHDLEGRNRTIQVSIMEGSHFSVLGDGSYFLCGNGQMRGRCWNEPLPSNIHFLAAISCGDINPCGKSGRWISGSTHGGRGPLRLADTRSGDGWEVMKAHSVICYPGAEDNSGPYDIDAKGSPDGTKITFISTYDIKDAPSTEITEDVTENRIIVKSTKGFPEKGRLVAVTGFHREVLAYERKTSRSFEGLTRGLYGTPVSSPSKGQMVTSFESRLIPEYQWKDLPLPARSIRNIIKDMDSPLMRQRSSDVYTAVVRLPDRPHLKKVSDYVELIPGENHWEIYGYHIFKDGKKITRRALNPGTSFTLPGEGTYTAVAVEWSELESKHSLPLKIQNTAALKILLHKPADFSWTSDRWLVEGKVVSKEEAKRSAEAVKEIVHLHDGVIHREWYNWGKIIKRYDLNLEGKPIRHLFYQNGKLARREYHNSNGIHVSTEFFSPDGYITESIRYYLLEGKSYESSHWWYERGMPVKNIRGSLTGYEVYLKDGKDRWVKK